MGPSSHVPVKLSIFPQEFLEVKFEFSLLWGCVYLLTNKHSLPVPTKNGQAGAENRGTGKRGPQLSQTLNNFVTASGTNTMETSRL